MTVDPRFTGVFAAMVTPFTDDGAALSADRLRAYCDFLVGLGVNGLFAFGTTGEWPLLAEEERTRGAEVLAGHAAGRLPVIVHAGAHSTGQAVRLAAAARAAGADAVSVLSPPFYHLDEAALADHFTAVARAVEGFPVFLYNIPEYAGNDISPDLLLRVASRADNVIGIKYSGDSIERLRGYRRTMGSAFRIFNGNDSLALAALREGADGIVSGNASARPELLTSLYAAFRAGRLDDAGERQAALDAFIEDRDGSCELSTFKALCALRGAPVGDVRSPLKRLPVEKQAELGRLLR